MPVLVKELAQSAKALGAAGFEARFGSAALLLKPPKVERDRAGMQLVAAGTVPMTSAKQHLDDLLVMLRGFRELSVFWLQKPDTALGRAPDCDVLLDEGSVSGHHARLTRDAAGWHVHDGGSRNGTWVNGRPIGPARQRLTDGDTLTFGEAQVIFLTARTLADQLASLGA